MSFPLRPRRVSDARSSDDPRAAAPEAATVLVACVGEAPPAKAGWARHNANAMASDRTSGRAPSEPADT